MLSETKSRYAGKKIIIFSIMISFLHLVGCHYYQQMNPDEFDFDGNWDMKVITKDTVYKFDSGDYNYKNDTLYADVSKPLDDRTNLKYTIGIPVEEIESIEAQKINILGTVTIIGTIVLVLLALSTMGDFSP